MVLVWPKINTQLIVLTVTPHKTLFVAFLGQSNGIEIDPLQHDLYPDLTHPAMAGILLSMWLRWNPQAWVSICRWAETGTPPSVEETLPKRWSITMDLGSFDQDAEGTYLGTAVARMLLQTWRRQRNLTPMSMPKPDISEIHRQVNGKNVGEDSD